MGRKKIAIARIADERNRQVLLLIHLHTSCDVGSFKSQPCIVVLCVGVCVYIYTHTVNSESDIVDKFRELTTSLSE